MKFLRKRLFRLGLSLILILAVILGTSIDIGPSVKGSNGIVSLSVNTAVAATPNEGPTPYRPPPQPIVAGQVVNPKPLSYATTLTDSPTANTGGNWTNPTYAYASDTNYATQNSNGGYNTYGTYGNNVSSGNVITQVRVRADAFENQHSTSQSKAITGNDANTGGFTFTGGASLWQSLNDASDTTYVTGVTNGGGYCTVAFTAFTIPTGSVITNLSLHLRERSATTTANASNAGTVVKVNGTYYGLGGTLNGNTDNGTTNIPGSGSAIADYTYNWVKNPNTGAAWTVADINGSGAAPLQFIGVGGTDFNPDVNFYKLDATVNYTSAPDDAIRLTVSWDGGTSWSANQSSTLTTSKATYWDNFTSATTWTIAKVNDTNFKVRVDSTTTGDIDTISLDWLPAEVTYDAIGAPTSFSATSRTSSSIALSWAKGAYADNTSVRYRTDQYPTGTGDGTSAYNGTGTSTNITGLSNGQIYYIRAWSYNNAEAAYSSSYAQLTDYTLPGNPSGLAKTSNNDTWVALSWTGGTGGDKTLVRYKTGSYPSSTSDGTQAYFNTGTSTNVTGLNPGTTYYWRAWAYDSDSTYYSGGTSDLTQGTTGTGWLTGYNYRQQFTIAGTTNGTQTNYQMPLNVDRSFPGSFVTVSSLDHAVYTAEKPVVVNGQRYIVTGTGIGGTSVGYIQVHEADAAWTRNDSVGHYWQSPQQTGEPYAKSFSTQIANKIIIYGTVNNGVHDAFITSFDVTTDTWDFQWIDIDTSTHSSPTNVLYADSTGYFYIMPAGHTGFANFVWKSSVANLLTPANWSQVSLPAWSPTSGESRMTYYASDKIVVIRTNHAFYYDVLDWTLSNNSFSTKLSNSDNTAWSQPLFTYVDSKDGRIGISLPYYGGGTPYADIRYSDDGSSYTHAVNLNFITSGGTGIQEVHCNVHPSGGNLLVFNTRDGAAASTANVYKLDGTVLSAQAGIIFTHYTEGIVLYDGETIVRGGEQFDAAGNCEVVVLSVPANSISLNSHALSWTSTVPNDLRFTDADGTTGLSYWIESSDTNIAYVWIKCPSLPASPSSATFYAYYGKSSDTTTSNGDNTFIFFDDFSGSFPSTKWTGDTSYGSVSGGILTVSGNTSGVEKYIASATGMGQTHGAFRARINASTPTSPDAGMFGLQNGTVARFQYGSGPILLYWFGGPNSVASNWTAGSYQIFDILVKSTGVTTFKDNASEVQGSPQTITSSSNMPIQLRIVSASVITVFTVDWTLLRNYADIEPTWGTWGAEEPNLTNSPSSKDFGVVSASSTYYAKGSAPNNPVQDGDCTFTITNTGHSYEDFAIKSSNATGGVGWTLTSSAPGTNTFRLTAYYSGQNPASGVILTNSNQAFYSNLITSGTIKWDFQLETGTFTDGVQKQWTITLTASSHY